MGLEQQRLAWFAEIGAPVEPRPIEDRHGSTVYAVERGEGDPVVMVHGGGGEAGGWGPMLAHLGVGRRWILVDRPGHGLSGPIDYTGTDYRRLAVEFMTDVLDGLDLERATLMGNSMGGYFALVFALAHPERVERLVLVGAPAGIDRWVPWPLRVLSVPVLNRVLFALQGKPTAEAIRKVPFGAMLVAHPERLSQGFLEVGVLNGSQASYKVAWRTLLQRALDLGGFRRSLMIREEAASLSVPTRFVWGDADAFAPPRSGRDLASRMPDASIDVVEGAGHLPWLDEPEAVASSVLASLDRSALGAA